jgi:hypothetical protein
MAASGNRGKEGAMCYTTNVVNEEMLGPSTRAVGEEDPTTRDLGEESFSTTMAAGEEGVVPCDDAHTYANPFGAF